MRLFLLLFTTFLIRAYYCVSPNSKGDDKPLPTSQEKQNLTKTSTGAKPVQGVEQRPQRQQQTVASSTPKPEELTSLSDLKSKVDAPILKVGEYDFSALKSKADSTIFDAVGDYEGELPVLRLTPKVGVTAKRLVFDGQTLWTCQGPNDACLSAIFYLGQSGPVAATYSVKGRKVFEGYRKFSGGQWTSVNKEGLDELLEELKKDLGDAKKSDEDKAKHLPEATEPKNTPKESPEDISQEHGNEIGKENHDLSDDTHKENPTTPLSQPAVAKPPAKGPPSGQTANSDQKAKDTLESLQQTETAPHDQQTPTVKPKSQKTVSPGTQLTEAKQEQKPAANLQGTSENVQVQEEAKEEQSLTQSTPKTTKENVKEKCKPADKYVSSKPLGPAVLDITKLDSSKFSSFEYIYDDNLTQLIAPNKDTTVTRLMNDKEEVWTPGENEEFGYARVYLDENREPRVINVASTISSRIEYNYFAKNGTKWECARDHAEKLKALKVVPTSKSDISIDLEREEDTDECRVLNVELMNVPTRFHLPMPEYHANEVRYVEDLLWAASGNERCKSCAIYSKNDVRLLAIFIKKGDDLEHKYFEKVDETWKDLTHEAFFKKYNEMRNA
ncbi:signal peptide containing protein [Theileria equi strain WA]|uniref:Signal peptide containing protein n=1 Tax=Theileria equi strain WA TaxID=1537102 RepID=L1LAX6_THEEQ|nr:signal peptide containing protein [Theileria equi strain WA]EKX72481.1 signal peptide containing protein [Theileria equi strain WA]|eukprot:XP_004831933.1 signal peptide containing protein [Theileria equi strain WA]